MKAAPHPEKRKIKPATLVNAMRHQADRHAKGQIYPEDLGSKVSSAVSGADPIQSQLQQVGQMPPAGRAKVGSMVGAFLGNKVAGAHGALLGAAIGSDATRGLGVAQSGEKDESDRQAEVLDALSKVHVINPDQGIKFKDGAVFSVQDPNTPTLNNVSPGVKGADKRTIYDLDDTNPYTPNTTLLAMPIAYYLVGGLLKHTDMQSPLTQKSVDSTATLLTNAFQAQANSLEEIQARSKETVKKIGVSKSQMQNFSHVNRQNISAQDSEKIKKWS